MSITITVLMTVYNTDFLLVKRAINSVLNQDFESYELIVIDDGSDPYLGQQILHYCQIHQHKIRYLRHPNCGQSQSINRGVQISTGKYIAIIDSDDEYKSNHLSSCLNEMQDADLICSFTDTVVSCEEDYYVPDKDNHEKSIHVDDCILFATLFGKKEVFLQLSFKNCYAADAFFYENAAQQFRVKKVNFCTYIYYRNNSNSISAKLKKKQKSVLETFNT